MEESQTVVLVDDFSPIGMVMLMKMMKKNATTMMILIYPKLQLRSLSSEYVHYLKLNVVLSILEKLQVGAVR